MKNSTICFVLALMAISELALSAVYLPNELNSLESEHTSENKFIESEHEENMPVIDLPVVEIFASPINKMYLPAAIIDGVPVAVIDLPTIEISTETGNESKEPADYYADSEINLPQIVIYAEPQKDNLVKATVDTDGNIFFEAELPEIVIESTTLTRIYVPALPEYNAFLIKSSEEENCSILLSSKFSEIAAWIELSGDCPVNMVKQNTFSITKNDQEITLIVHDHKYVMSLSKFGRNFFNKNNFN